MYEDRTQITTQKFTKNILHIYTLFPVTSFIYSHEQTIAYL